MEKRLLMVMVALFAMVMQMRATTNQTSVVPTVKKVVVVIANNVNIRKKPDVKSAKIGSAAKGVSFLVIGEDDDWYTIVTNEEPDDPREGIPYVNNGYIMKKFCADAELVPLTASMLNDDENCRYDMVTKGQHKGTVIMQDHTGYMTVEWVGKVQGNIWCFDKWVLQGELYKDLHVDTDDNGMYDIRKLTDAQISTILRKASIGFARAAYCVKGQQPLVEYYYRENH